MENMIDPEKILGSITTSNNGQNSGYHGEFAYRQMSNDEIIKVQTLLLDKLASKLSQYDTKSSTF